MFNRVTGVDSQQVVKEFYVFPTPPALACYGLIVFDFLYVTFMF